MALSIEEKSTIQRAEKLTTRVWRLVAKDHGVEWEDYKRVPYWTRMEDLQATMERLQ